MRKGLRRVIQMIKNLLQRLVWKRKSVFVGGHCVIANTLFKSSAKIEPYCRIIGSPCITIGDCFYMNCTCHLLGDITIGDNVQIGPQTVIWGRDHQHDAGQNINKQGHSCAPVILGNDVWIGAHVTILKGVHIHNGAIVGAGAVVVDDIPENAIAVGNPARVIKFRS